MEGQSKRFWGHYPSTTSYSNGSHYLSPPSPPALLSFHFSLGSFSLFSNYTII